MRDPELVARAERGARRLESAWENWRAQHGLANAPGQPIVSYVGYSLTEPWGEPRVVIGIDADEAEYLADFLERDDGAHVQLPRQQAGPASSSSSPAFSSLPASPVLPVSPGMHGSPAGSSSPGVPGSLAEGSGEYQATALVGTSVPVGIGHQAQSQDMGTELPGWSPGERTDQPAWSQAEHGDQPTWSAGERADQAAEQLAGWQGGTTVPDQPPVTT
jgi:hypothetical protein